MDMSPGQVTERGLSERREEIRCSLSRVNTASVAVVLVTIALAVTAGLGALRASRQAERASEANQRARDELWKSYLAQARAGRLSGVVGRKASGLQAIAAAAAIRPSVELRSEAIAHMALLDFEPTGLAWTNAPGLGHTTVDLQFERHLEADAHGTIRIRRIAQPDAAFLLRSTNGFVHWADFAPQGKLLAVIYQDTALTLWDLESRAPQFSRPGIAWAGFDERGALLAVAGDDRVVRVLDAATGREQASFAIGARAGVGVFDPEGSRLALALPTGVQIWDWAKGQMTESFEVDHPVWSVAWRGHCLAVGDGAGEVHVWNLVSKRARRLQAHQSTANHVCFNPRGDVLVSTSYDGSTRAWDPHTGRLLLTATHGFGTRFSPDGQRLLFRTQSGWSVWRVAEPEGFRVLNCVSGPLPNVWHADFSQDGQWLTATKGDGICVFRVADGQRVCFQPVNQARAAYVLPETRHLLTTSTRRIAVWPIETNGAARTPTFRLGERQLIALTNVVHLEPGALSGDRKRLALPVSQSEVAVVDLERRLETGRLTRGLLPKSTSFSSDQRWLATGTFHGVGARVWDLATGRVLQDFKNGNSSVFFSPDGRFFASAGSRTYQVFETSTWKPVFEAATDSGSDLPNLAAFTGDSTRFAMVKELNRVELRDVGEWGLAAALLPPDSQVVTWLAFSPDHRHLAVSTSQDLVQLWDFQVLQRELAALGLDWDQSVEAATALAAGAGSNLSRMAGADAGVRWIVPVILGALVGIAGTVFIRHRQRHLLAAYMEGERLGEQQRQQLARAQTEVLHAQKMKALGTLATGIAHDFNNLLSVIRMSNQLTAEAVPDHSEVRENAQEVEQAVQQGKKIVRSMLGYSREDPDDARPFRLAEVVEDTVGLLRKQFLSGIALTLNLSAEVPPLRLSRNRLEQMLLNLIVNASEAMHGQGTLTITVRPGASSDGTVVLRPHAAGRYCELAVRDSGPGIDPDLQKRIFEPFFTTKQRGTEPGTGLGLSMVYRVAEHDGLGLQLDSVPGQGAEFRLIIPLAE